MGFVRDMYPDTRPYPSNETYFGRDNAPSSTLWQASAWLVECRYCGAQPFNRCHTFGEPHKTQPYTHTVRWQMGHDLLRKALKCEDTRAALNALESEPPVPTMQIEEITQLVESIVDKRLAVRKQPARKPATRKRAAR